MAEIKIVNEKPISLFDMKKNLEEIKKRDKELNFRAKKTDEYLNSVVKIKKYKELYEELETLDVLRLKDKHIIKIIDILPINLDSVRMIFSNEPITIKQEDLQKICDTVKKYA